jgi:hypothetical protein
MATLVTAHGANGQQRLAPAQPITLCGANLIARRPETA